MEYEVLYTTDPSHGWGRVHRSLLNELGIADRISAYSYQKGEFVYLEEDCDLHIFLHALKQRGDTYKIVEQYVERTHIRKLPNYKYEETITI
jgi:hypothetical protein